MAPAGRSRSCRRTRQRVSKAARGSLFPEKASPAFFCAARQTKTPCPEGAGEASSGLRGQAHIQQFPAQVRIGSHQPDGPVGLVIG